MKRHDWIKVVVACVGIMLLAASCAVLEGFALKFP